MYDDDVYKKVFGILWLIIIYVAFTTVFHRAVHKVVECIYNSRTSDYKLDKFMNK